MKHYIGMNGSHGCLPDSCNVYLTRRDAAMALVSLLELSKRQERDLLAHDYVECRPEQGAEYCGVIECSCTAPHKHQDGETEESFYRNSPEFAPEE